jgi:hypothetical protein
VRGTSDLCPTPVDGLLRKLAYPTSGDADQRLRCGRAVAQTAVRSNRVVLSPPVPDQHATLHQPSMDCLRARHPRELEIRRRKFESCPTRPIECPSAGPLLDEPSWTTLYSSFIPAFPQHRPSAASETVSGSMPTGSHHGCTPSPIDRTRWPGVQEQARRGCYCRHVPAWAVTHPTPNPVRRRVGDATPSRQRTMYCTRYHYSRSLLRSAKLRSHRPQAGKRRLVVDGVPFGSAVTRPFGMNTESSP